MVTVLFSTYKHEIGTDRHCLILVTRGDLNICFFFFFFEDVKNKKSTLVFPCWSQNGLLSLSSLDFLLIDRY